MAFSIFKWHFVVHIIMSFTHVPSCTLCIMYGLENKHECSMGYRTQALDKSPEGTAGEEEDQ